MTRPVTVYARPTMTVYRHRMTVQPDPERDDDTARLITIDELAARLGCSVRTLRRSRRVADDGREYYDVLGTPVARVSTGGRAKPRVPLPDVVAAIRNAGMAS